jgi:NADH-quinone oxidoreductase subunit L
MVLDLQILLLAACAPLFSAIIAGLLGSSFVAKPLPKLFTQYLIIIAVLISFIASAYITYDVIMHNASFNKTVYTWMEIGRYKLEVGFLIDRLTASMMCVVTFVSLMVHIYTLGYMADDAGKIRFFAYISLFTFAMLMLVMSNNLMQLFFGWEAVGVVSYLLIGFWFGKNTAIFANLKAFLVNRIGDLGFILGIALVAIHTGSFNYSEIFAERNELLNAAFHLNGFDISLITLTCVCLFIGAMGKSAQFPLHVWLPDSMEGPTPISALIHAATMVTAGIFMVSRMSPLFELSDTALSYILITGSITALFMGFLGIVQTDIKRVVAYSTLSQLGYMTIALGVSAYPVAVFHLITHAFFKALLFLGAGSVIMGCHHNQDMRYMGNIKKYMPVTWITSLIGSLALIGTPFLSGFYSKDSIIEAVHSSTLFGAKFAYFSVVAGVFITAFYSFRMYFLVFHGKERYEQDPHANEHHGLTHGHKPHESPLVVTLPLILLAIPSICIGAYMLMPIISGDFFASGVAFEQIIYIDLIKHPAMLHLQHHIHNSMNMAIHALTTLPFILTIAGVFFAWLLYIYKPQIPEKIKSMFKPLHHILDNKYYLDDFNQAFFANGCLKIGRQLWKYIDMMIIDGLIVNGFASVSRFFSCCVKKMQTGHVYHYAIVMTLGIFCMLAYVITQI